MEFSTTFFDTGDVTEDTILHEMAHALGFGLVGLCLALIAFSKHLDADTAVIFPLTSLRHLGHDVTTQIRCGMNSGATLPLVMLDPAPTSPTSVTKAWLSTTKPIALM
jgi:hypothetical protein